MLQILTAVILVASTPAFAQHASTSRNHNHAGTNHQQMVSPNPARVPTEPGQSAFAAIQEIVQILEADPHTDWSKVDIEELRQHLIDMNNVTLNAEVNAVPVESGVRFTVQGAGPVRDSIRRMVTAHASTMNGVDGWRFAAEKTRDGATLTVIVPPADLPKVTALGFIGVMTHGMHHQEHHLMIARGAPPHG